MTAIYGSDAQILSSFRHNPEYRHAEPVYAFLGMVPPCSDLVYAET